MLSFTVPLWRSDSKYPSADGDAESGLEQNTPVLDKARTILAPGGEDSSPRGVVLIMLFYTSGFAFLLKPFFPCLA